MAKKEPKEKKTKEKKPPKEKKPKEKKPKEKKPPKPKKEKAPKKKKADGDEGGKKGGKKTLLLIIIIGVVAAAAAVTAIFTLRSIGGGDEPQTLEEPEDGEDGESDGEEGGDSEEGEDGDESGDAEDETPAPSKAPDPLKVATAMTTTETLEYIRRFTPASLGLSGQSMDDYEIYAADNVVLVDGYTCSELSVYSKDASAGTNDIEGWFLLSRGSDRTLFRLDRETGELTKLDPERSTDSS